MKNPAPPMARRAGLKIEYPTYLSTRSLPQPNPPRNPVFSPELREKAARVYALGERPFVEFIREVAAGADPLESLLRYVDIDTRVLAAYGGRELDHRLRLAGEL
jgi:hypothetical protein